MTDTAELTTAMRQVDPNAIESELNNDWRAANARALAGGGQAAARTSVMTLVIYSDNDAQAQRAVRAVRALTSQHPSRCVVVVPLDASESDKPLQAYIQTHAEDGGGAKSYGEEIVLRATSSAATHLAGAILPLISSGLPAFLWWQGEPPWGAALFEATIDGFDRLLVDTSEMGHPDQSLISLEDVLRRKKASCAITDFNFARLNPWRELVARFFDAEELRPYLNSIDRLSIEYAAGEADQPSNAAQAYLFAGWLASRLGWRTVGGGVNRLVDGGREHTMQDISGRHISLEINARYGVPIASWFDITTDGPGSQAVGPGALMSIYLRSQRNGATATFTVAREERDLRHASTNCQAPQISMPAQAIHMPSLGESSSLGAELERVGHDLVFEETLAVVSQMLAPAARRSRS